LEAVGIAIGYNPHVAILDVGMPQLNGYELCQRFRDTANLSAMKIATQSGYGDAASSKNPLKRGSPPLQPSSISRLPT
jgi:two-component system, chemotaxis family, sensor kinase Cph1